MSKQRANNKKYVVIFYTEMYFCLMRFLIEITYRLYIMKYDPLHKIHIDFICYKKNH